MRKPGLVRRPGRVRWFTLFGSCGELHSPHVPIRRGEGVEGEVVEQQVR